MSTMIQIRNVPDDVHRKLKARAAMARTSLTEYLLNQLEAWANTPTWEEFDQRLSLGSKVRLPRGSVNKYLRQERASR